MTEEEMKSQKKLHGIVIGALERRPEVAIPADFAARLARSLPAKAPARDQRAPIFGRAAGYLALVVMTVVLVFLARIHPEALAAGKGFLFGVESLLVVQLLAVGYWLGMRSDR